MNRDDFKKNSVIVGSGSGCLFQPMTQDYTYILTAKHLFYARNQDEQGLESHVQFPDGKSIEIVRYIKPKDVWVEERIHFNLIEGKTYFPHKCADIAILKISPAIKGLNNIRIEEEIRESNCYELCGYPSNCTKKRKYSIHKIENFIVSDDYSYHARLFGTLRQDDIQGMSGCGILSIVYDTISVIGIQSKMGSKINPSGEIEFVPIKHFNEIVEYSENQNELVALLPSFLMSFESIKNIIFELQEGIITKDISSRLIEVLKLKSEQIISSDLTPYEIKCKLSNNLMLIENKEFNNYNSKNFWRVWLELLTIISISELHSEKELSAEPLSKGHLSKILKKVRLFYADSDKCFWLENIDKLHRMNYHGLALGSTVVVASNVKAEGMHMLDTDLIVGDITRAENKFEEDKMLGKIDCATDFPLKKYKFINISVFKEGTVDMLEDKFEKKLISGCIKELKKIYGEILLNG